VLLVATPGMAGPVPAVAAGAYHTCALTSGGGVSCWGNNGHGALGDGTTTTRLTPVVVSGLSSGVTVVAAGSSQTCAVTSGGGVVCWGYNTNGQLGDGTTTQRLTPVAVSGLASGVTAVATGAYHTCAVTSGGGVVCWGDNGFGQLGDGTTTQRLTPVAVSGLASGVTAVATGAYHTCAVTSGGGVVCWGDNGYGQVGDGTTTSQRLTPVAVSGLASGVTVVAAGSSHTCAVTSGGGVSCWGNDGNGQLGDGTTTMQRRTPVAVSGLASGVTAVATGTTHTCALTSGGGVSCWGNNGDGQLGDGTTSPRYTPVAVSGLSSGVTVVAAGGSHTCAVTSGGGVVCWGYNSSGQLGDGTSTQRLTPVSVNFGSSITAHPVSVSVAVGGTATFSAAASGSPAPTVQWQVSTNTGSTFTNISGATAGTYSFVAGAADTGKQFRAVFTNSVGTATTNAATLTVNAATSAPSVTTHPSNQTMTAGATASFSAAASGSPSPTVQWQVSTNTGSTFTNISGATAGTYAFVAGAADTGKQFRAVFTNSAGTATSNAATLTVSATAPTMALDKTALVFSALTSGAAFTAQTSAQTVRLTQTGAGTVTWTAASTTPWLVVSPASGTGSATLSVGVQFSAGLAAAQAGTITLAFTGASNTAGPITVTLTVVSSTAAVSPPFGVFDTPAGDATVLAGSIALTGWTLDNVGVARVELWRDLQAGETTPPFASTPSDPRNGKIFISNAIFVDGARPDVEALYPTTPFAYRAGWGYLLLTWGLWNQGNGTYRLYAFAFDQENNLGTIGTKTIIVSNSTATKPFGSIDTPAIGGDASGPNFGWGLTPKVNGVATCKIQPSGVQVSIDSGPLQPVVYGADVRTDIAGAFTGFSNSAAAGGHFIVDWTTLPTGPHTIGWLITDDCNRADGVGSRFFNVSTGTSLTASSVVSGFPGQSAVEGPGLSAVEGSRTNEPESPDPITVARGYGELPEIVTPGEAGSRTVEVTQGERIEIRVPHGFESAYQLVNGGQRRALPTGATWDVASGTFYWQPAAGFLGHYRIVFTNGVERISVRVVVVPPGSRE
jgi:alpha-tubulin suppressor-like RCC1 family protein